MQFSDYTRINGDCKFSSAQIRTQKNGLAIPKRFHRGQFSMFKFAQKQAPVSKFSRLCARAKTGHQLNTSWTTAERVTVFRRIHHTLKHCASPQRWEPGVSDHVWSLDDVIALL